MTRVEWSNDDAGMLPSVIVAAHELKSPLALIRQMSLLLESTDNLSADRREKLQKQITTVSDQALSLVSDLSRSANLSPSLFPLEPVNPLSVCRQIASETKALEGFYNKNITWPKSRRRSELMVGNRELLTRILSNFINNAIRYSEGGVDIQVKVSRRGKNMRLGVRDFGPKITKRDYQKMVDSIENKKTARTRPDSSGLGVYVASQFAKSMGGEIGLLRHSDGLTFYVELPISQQMSLI